MKKKFEITVPDGSTKVLLHACCAPCSSAIVECMMQHGITPTIYYCNPNIYPESEYLIRRDECQRYAKELGLEMVEAEYDHEDWLCHVKGLEAEPERGGRCLKCFRMRLKKTAEYAHKHGYSDNHHIGFVKMEKLGTDKRSGNSSCRGLRRRNLVGPELAQGRTDRTQSLPHKGMELL